MANDPWARYSPQVKEKLKANNVIQDAIRNMKARGHDKAYAQKISGAPFEVVDKIYNEKRPHDTRKRLGEEEDG